MSLTKTSVFFSPEFLKIVWSSLFRNKLVTHENSKPEYLGKNKQMNLVSHTSLIYCAHIIANSKEALQHRPTRKAEEAYIANYIDKYKILIYSKIDDRHEYWHQFRKYSLQIVYPKMIQYQDSQTEKKAWNMTSRLGPYSQVSVRCSLFALQWIFWKHIIV